MRATKTVSFWSFLLLAVLLLLQLFPITGIFLMFFGGAMLAGLLVHVFLISLLIEGYLRRVPRVLMILPIVAYGGYYALYAKQTLDIARKAAELRASNPKQVLDFDPKTQALVTANAQALIQSYAIPAVYQPNPNYTEGYLSYRLIPRGECMVARDSQGRIITFGIFLNHRLQKQVCVLRFPEMPEGKIVKAVRSGDDEIWRRKWGISEQTTTLSIDDKVIGTYRSAFVWRLPLLPVGFVGCALIDSSSSWQCGADFMRHYQVLDTVPAGVDRAKYGLPLSVMLGLKKYTEADLANFHGYAVNDGALARVAQEPKRVENDVFKVLAAILDGHNVKPTFNMGYSLAQNPERLAPLAEKMAARLVALDQEDVRRPNRREQMRALATALASLPPPAFQRVADQAFDVVQRTRGGTAFHHFMCEPPPPGRRRCRSTSRSAVRQHAALSARAAGAGDLPHRSRQRQGDRGDEKPSRQCADGRGLPVGAVRGFDEARAGDSARHPTQHAPRPARLGGSRAGEERRDRGGP